jgi:putative DNA primase/helicase
MFDSKNGILYRWTGKFWEEYDREYLEQSCINYLRNEAKKDKIGDASYQARILSTMPIGRTVNDHLDYICLQNGMLNIDTFELLPHDPKYLATFVLPVEFDPESKKRCEVFEQFLESSVQNKEAIAQLQEFAGYIISRDTKYEKCLFLLGPGRDGKSKFINAMKDMVGLENMSAVSFADLEKGFDRSSLYNKMLNTSTEIGNSVIESPYFKAITSGDPIQAAFKYVNNFTFIPYCKLLFAGNMLPRIKDNSDALMERLLIVKFPRQFLEGDPERDVHLGDKLKEERSEIFYWALCGLKRLRDQGRFTDSVTTRKLLMDFRRSNNPILCFVEDRCILGDGQEVSKQDLYSEYDKYCRQNGYKPTNSNNFFRELYHAVGRLKIYQSRAGELRPRMAEGIGLKPSEGVLL